MALKTRNCVGLAITINTDGFVLGGGTTSERSITLASGNISVVGSGAATLTFPAVTDTVVGRIENHSITLCSIGGYV